MRSHEETDLHALSSKANHLRQERSATTTALLVEHRDEVVARLLANLSQSEMSVVHVDSASRGFQYFHECAPCLVIANVDLPDESGWLMASKLRMVKRPARVWLYKPWSSPADDTWQTFAGIERLIYYRDDFNKLSEQIVSQLVAEEPSIRGFHIAG